MLGKIKLLVKGKAFILKSIQTVNSKTNLLKLETIY